MADKFRDESFDEIIRETLESLEEARPKASRTRDGKKVPGKYLTKDKAAMKGEIERVSKLKSDDPSAYGKWKADYKSRNTEGGKPHKTKKSAATIAYEKKFGKKNENLNLRETEMGNENIDKCYSEIREKLLWGQFGVRPIEVEIMAEKYGLDNDTVQDMYFELMEEMRKNMGNLDYAVQHALRRLYSENPYSDREFYVFEWYWNRNNYADDFKNVSEPELKSVWEKHIGSIGEIIDELNENTDKALATKAKASGISKSILRSVYSKGAAAWKSGHRPGVSQQQWAMGRVNSFITGKGGARKADAELWARAKKSKKRKNESLDESHLRKTVRAIIKEMYENEDLGKFVDMTGADMTSIIPYSDFLTALGNDFGWDHDLTKQIAYALEIKDASKREGRIIALLNDYDVYDDYFHYLRMNEGNGLDELYPLMVGEGNVDEGIGKYVAGAALGLGLALGSPGKAMAQDVSKDNVNKPKIVKTFQNLKKSVFDKKIEPEPEKTSGNKIGGSKPVRVDGGTDTVSIDSLMKQTGKVTKIGDNKYQTVEREDFSGPDEWNFNEDILRVKVQERMHQHLNKYVPPNAMPKTVVFKNPNGTYTMFAVLEFSPK